MAISSVKDSSTRRDGSHQGLGEIVDERSCRERTEWPRDGTPKGARLLLGVCGTLGQLDYFVALALQ